MCISYRNITIARAYSDNNVDNFLFAGDVNNSDTSHIWLNRFSSNNNILIPNDIVLIDDGDDNLILET